MDPPPPPMFSWRLAAPQTFPHSFRWVSDYIREVTSCYFLRHVVSWMAGGNKCQALNCQYQYVLKYLYAYVKIAVLALSASCLKNLCLKLSRRCDEKFRRRGEFDYIMKNLRFSSGIRPLKCHDFSRCPTKRIQEVHIQFCIINLSKRRFHGCQRRI